MKNKHPPIFHKDGSITYYLPTYGWQNRVHPSRVSKKSLADFTTAQLNAWKRAMLQRGFIESVNGWIPAHTNPKKSQ